MPRTPSLELYVLPSGGGQLMKFQKSSGAEGDRTPDLCSAIAALSQLSYSPARTRRTVLEPFELIRRTGSSKSPADWAGPLFLNLAVPPLKSRPNFSLGSVTLCLASRYNRATRYRTSDIVRSNNRTASAELTATTSCDLSREARTYCEPLRTRVAADAQ